MIRLIIKIVIAYFSAARLYGREDGIHSVFRFHFHFILNYGYTIYIIHVQRTDTRISNMAKSIPEMKLKIYNGASHAHTVIRFCKYG